jgi:hypothetical protein
LVQQTKSPQGQPIKKVVVFNRHQAAVQVSEFRLQDAQGKEICAAYITEVQQPVPGIVLPKRVRLVWPAEQIELKMKLDEVTVNRPLAPEQLGRLFTRPQLANVPSYDLARGPDGRNGVRPAAAFQR